MRYQRISSKRSIIAAAGLASLGLVGTSGAAISGFGGTATSTSQNSTWTLNAGGVAAANGVPNVVGTGTSADVLTLTTATNGESSSAWYNTPQSITNFSESFTYTDVSHNGADGIAAVWQNAGTTALGTGGGGLGFAGIATSAGLAMNVYSGNSGSGSEYDALPAGGNVALTPTPGGVNIDSGDPINVSLNYIEANGALTETMTDSVTSATFTRVWRGISIAGSVGGSTAYVGLTGATGGVNTMQSVTNFQFASGAAIPTPVAAITPIAATGYNQNMIISVAGGTANLTATIDNGTNGITNVNTFNNGNNNTFFEKGVDTNNGAAEGVPQAGAVFGSATDSNHTFVLQPNGAGQNDALMLDTGHTTGALTLTGSSAYSVLSFLVSGGNGGAAVSILVNYANGSSQTASITVPDWFNNSPIAYDTNGRASVSGSPLGFNNEDNGNPRMYQEDITLTDTTDAVTSVQFTYAGPTTSGANNRAVVFGISGTAVPEPATLGVVAIGGLGLMARRRRSVQ